jgi:hypothetical protein
VSQVNLFQHLLNEFCRVSIYPTKEDKNYIKRTNQIND